LDHAPALPPRPLTGGELLDAAVVLVRANAAALLLPAALLAGVEQGVLSLLRELMGVPLVDGLPPPDEIIGSYWFLLAAGAATEAMIISAVGPVAGRAAVADLLRERLPAGTMVRAGLRRLPALLMITPIVGLLVAAGTLFGPFWLPAYAVFGLAGALLTIERRGPGGALGRAATLAVRGGMRATWIRLLGYFSWLVLRFGFFLGLGFGAELIGLGRTATAWMIAIGLVVINTAAYASLAALDAVTLLELRIRLEGLDLWLARAAARGPVDPNILAVTR
jgi:hypothetical protein